MDKWTHIERCGVGPNQVVDDKNSIFIIGGYVAP